MAQITLDEVTKEYSGGVRAVDAVELEIGSGEFLVLVGPSGCGKSTLLRMIAGLEVPRDVALVGRDDTTFARVTSPTLTSVDLGGAERARLAAELLLARIDQPKRRVRTVAVEPKLVVRHSCGVGQ